MRQHLEKPATVRPRGRQHGGLREGGWARRACGSEVAALEGASGYLDFLGHFAIKRPSSYQAAKKVTKMVAGGESRRNRPNRRRRGRLRQGQGTMDRLEAAGGAKVGGGSTPDPVGRDGSVGKSAHIGSRRLVRAGRRKAAPLRPQAGCLEGQERGGW